MSNYEAFHMGIQQNYMQWQKFLDWWAGRKFMREIVFGYEHPVRKITKDTNHLIKQMLFFCDPRQNTQRNRKHPHVWLTVYSFRKEDLEDTTRPRPRYNTAVINRILFDFDAKIAGTMPTLEELRKPYEEASTIADEGGIMVFSGRKGFQVHLLLMEEITVEELGRRQRHREDLWGFETSDKQIYGDAARVCRMPFSVHPVTDLCCVLCRPGETLESIYARAHRVQPPEVL